MNTTHAGSQAAMMAQTRGWQLGISENQKFEPDIRLDYLLVSDEPTLGKENGFLDKEGSGLNLSLPDSRDSKNGVKIEEDSIQAARRQRTEDLKRNSTFRMQEPKEREQSNDMIMNYNESEEHVINPIQAFQR